MNLQEAIRQVGPSVVQIQTPSGAGTGFLVNDRGYIATAYHVVREVFDDGRVLVGFAHENTENMRANWTVVDAEIIASNEQHDLAIVKSERNPFAGEIGTGIGIGGTVLPLPHAAAILDPGRPDDGEPIAISGYPLSNPVLITTSGAIASVWTYETHETPVPGAPTGFTKPTFVDAYISDVQGNPGNSGGPAYRIEDGAVIGVCIQVQGAPTWNAEGEIGEFSANAGLTVLRPAQYVLDLLDSEVGG